MPRPIQKRHLLLWAALLALALVALLAAIPIQAQARPAAAEGAESIGQLQPAAAPQADLAPAAQSSDQACRLCHLDSEESFSLPSGETVSVQVDAAILADSAHGNHADQALACTDCHSSTEYQFPHQPVEAADYRSYQLDRGLTCERCHTEPHLTAHPGPDDAETPVGCTDCHGAHDVRPLDSWLAVEQSQLCSDCHTQVGVELANATTLANIIEAGLFTDEADNDFCLACHSQPGIEVTFFNGETTSATIDAQALHDSVHGEGNSWQPLACVDCHLDYTYPHEQLRVISARDYSLQKYELCARCHETNYELSQDSSHARALAEGNEEAAVCTDCHGAHNTLPPGEPRERISHTCEQCHSTIFAEYAESVHGDALLTDSNPDVPTCINCHGVHNIGDPTTALFRIRSPQLCAECHADEDLMGQYDISTEVFDTYVADFHGTTVTLFEHQDPEVETNKAVCYDCHGVHDIKSPDDPDAGIKANLLETCQQCHPDATANFSDAWTSHFQPSPDNNPLVYAVNLFYSFVIPATVAGFGFLVFTDVFRRVRVRLLNSRNEA